MIKIHRPSRTGNDRGSTLLEIILVAGIASMLGLLVTRMTILSFDLWREGEGRMQLQERVEQVLKRLSREVRQADKTNLTISGSSLSFRIPQDLDGDGTILDTDGATEFGADITYTLTGEYLVRQQDLDGDSVAESTVPGEIAILASGVSGLEFQAQTIGVQVTLTLQVRPLPTGASSREETVTALIATGNRSGGS
ncbi:MAG: hypothetical protein O7H41_05540 [Planctomycetota bacterium]|nr:hypothetical protein [Planctomycetota bacterium]